jgi:type I restriction enzyme S subunit
MSSDWQVRPLSDVAEVVGGGTPSTKRAELWDGGIPWLTPKDLSGHDTLYINGGSRSISEAGLAESSARLLPAGTVVVSSRAPIGYVAVASRELSTNQGFRSLVLKNGHVPEFFAYLLKANTGRLEAVASGSTFREITGSSLKQLTFAVPLPNEQRRIAGVLGALDDKVEHNRVLEQRLMDTLDIMFRQFITGPWSLEPLGDQVEVIMGQSPPGSTYSDDPKSGLPLVQGMAAFGERSPHTNIYTSTPTKCAQLGDVLMTVRAPVGAINVADRPCCAGRGVAIVRSHRLAYVEQLMRYLEPSWLEHETGTIYPSVNRLQILSIEAPRPSDDAIARFESRAQSLYELVGTLARERAQLTLMRDVLLPKLVSGKIRVPESYDPAGVLDTLAEQVPT